MNIVILDGNAVNPGDLSWDFLNKFGNVTYYARTDCKADAIARMQGMDIVLLNKIPIKESVLEACPTVKLICALSTGYNVIDVEACKKRGVVVCNVPGYGTSAVAQFTFALLLELCHHVGAHSQSVFRGQWTNSKDFCYWFTPQRELAGKTMGIIGFGAIGRAVGTIAKAFGMNVLAYSRTRHAEYESIGKYVDLDELLAQSDVISLHCPLFPETAQIINAETIEKMKNGILLLNTSRGGLVDEEALAGALASGKIAAYGADVASREPIRGDNPLLNAPNCVLTPHMAWAPLESRQRILDATEKNIEGFLNSQPVNAVNL